jgi:hypothetical protein
MHWMSSPIWGTSENMQESCVSIYCWLCNPTLTIPCGTVFPSWPSFFFHGATWCVVSLKRWKAILLLNLCHISINVNNHTFEILSDDFRLFWTVDLRLCIPIMSLIHTWKRGPTRMHLRTFWQMTTNLSMDRTQQLPTNTYSSATLLYAPGLIFFQACAALLFFWNIRGLVVDWGSSECPCYCQDTKAQ